MERAPTIRVAFVITAGAEWLGGVSYFSNLLLALAATPEIGIDSVVYHSSTSGVPDRGARKTVRLRMLDARGPARFFRECAKTALGFDAALEARGLADRVDLISHAHVGRTLRLPVITWIQDVQHRRLPEYFTSEERAARDSLFESVSRGATIVLASSDAARSDIEQFYPAARGKVRVLRFVHCSIPEATDPVAVAQRHGIDRPFVLLPNQFWAHKNHQVVVDALGILRKKRGRGITVVCTGSTHDHRKPEFFGTLLRRIQDAGVTEDFRILGIIPYADLASLMRQAVAIVNPSLFEGWSTSVEEAKTLGKRVLLSSIAVHREQAPERGVYFDPRDPEALSAALNEAYATFDPEEERAWEERARNAMPARRRAFAETYAAIARKARELGPRRS